MIISWEEYTSYTNELANKITEDMCHFDLIIAVGTGGLIPAMLLSRQLAIPAIQVITIQSYRGSQKSDPVVAYSELHSLHDKNILCVDDIVATGETFASARKEIEKVKPNSIKFASPVVSARVCTTYPDYWGAAIMRGENDFIEFSWDAPR